MNTFQENMQKKMPKILLLVYPLYAGFAYLITHMEILSFLGKEFSQKKEEGFPVFDTGPDYRIFIAIFIISILFYILWNKFSPLLSSVFKRADSKNSFLSFFIIKVQIVSSLALLGVAYTALFGFYPENLLFFVLPFLFHIKLLQDFKGDTV